MCVTMAPAKLSNTILYAAETRVGGELRHVLGYQNRAKNLAPGPNAMILPFPAAAPMGPGNVVDTTACPHVLEDAARAAAPAPQSAGPACRSLSASPVQVFDAGAYTVVLATDARAIPDALPRVPANKRPALAREVFEPYADWYPGWPIALCCFDGTIESEPMLWWYVPKDPTRFFLPALDAHDGRAPDLDARVQVDHTLVFGSCVAPSGNKVLFRDAIPEAAAPYLARQVIGTMIHQRMPNGDFWHPVEKIRYAKASPARVAPGR